MRDLFYENLKREISKFYDEEYCGNISEKNQKKQMHLELLHMTYEPKRFTPDKIHTEKIKYLTELQNMLDHGLDTVGFN